MRNSCQPGEEGLPSKVLRSEAPNMEDRLTLLDWKMDRLTLQLEACFHGIQTLNGKHHSVDAAESRRSSHLLFRDYGADREDAKHVADPVALPTSGCSVHGNVKVRRNSVTEPVTLHSSNSSISARRNSLLSALTPGSTAGGGYKQDFGNFDVFIQQRQRKLKPWQQLIWKFLSDPESGPVAWFYNRLSPAFILLVVVFSLMQTTPWGIINPELAMVTECAIEVFFFLEVCILFVVCPSPRHFFLKSYNIIDIVSVMPLVPRLYCIMTKDIQDIYTIIFGGLVPVVRLLKTLRRFQTFRLLTSAFLLAREAIPVLIFFYAVVWLLFSAIVFAVEDRSNIPSVPDAMWLAFVSMTTLGYGDVVPTSGAGRIAVAGLVMVSNLYMAIPLGIIGSCFSAVWADRDCILLFERLRSCFLESGCSHWDVPHLFSLFDKNKNGSLDALEFMDMASHLKLGLSEDRLMRLFKLWADEDGLRIEATGFQMALFPEACMKELAKQRLEEANFGKMAPRPSTRTETPIILSTRTELSENQRRGSAESQNRAGAE